MRKIFATLAAIVFSTSAFAVDLSSLSGSLGVTGNYGLYGADGKEENTNVSGTLERTTKKDGAAFVDGYASIFAELNFNDNFAVGVDYVFGDVDTPKNINSGEGGDGTTDIEVEAAFEELTTIYALLKTDIGVYAKLGFSTMDINITSKNAGTYKDPGNTDGEQYAIGYEHEADNGVAVRAELAYHEFDSVSANNGQTDKNTITVTNMRGATARLSLVKSF